MASKQYVACEWFERVWNQKDPAAVHQLSTPDMIGHGPEGTRRGPADFVAFQAALGGAMPDLHVDVKRCVEGRDMIAVEWIARGTHTGHTLGAPTGRQIEVSGLTLVRVVDGKCAEGWDDYDAAGLMRQLGAGV